MNAQDLILGSRVAHVRELKTEIAALKAENMALKSELEALRAHFDFALLAAEELRQLVPGARMEIWDGWNLILGIGHSVKDRKELVALAKTALEERPDDMIWIVFDGHDENVKVFGRLRISYTGGTGEHRADRQIVDFVRMAKYLGLEEKVLVKTNDKDFLSQLRRIVSR